MNDQPFHCARGSLPAGEQGLSGRARVTRLPNGKLVGIFRLETSSGPFVLSAELSSVKAQAAARAIAPEAAPALSGGGPWPYGSGDLSSAGGAGGASRAERMAGRVKRTRPSAYSTYANDMATLRENAVALPAPQHLSLSGGPHHGHHHHGGGGGGGRGWGGWGGWGPAYGPVYDLPLITVAPESLQSETPYVVATAKDPLTLRASPAGNPIGTLSTGSTFFVRNSQGGWAQGRSASGQIGWASMQYLRPVTSLAGGAAPPSWGNAERIYSKLMERDPRAWQVLRTLVARTQQGDPEALKLWGGVCAAHKRAHAGDFTRASPAERAAADRMYLRFRQGDARAKAEIEKIVSLAEQGDAGAIRAWKLLCLRHDDAKQTASMGASITFHPDRVRDLLEIIALARSAPPPRGYLGTPVPYPQFEEPMPMGMPPSEGAPAPGGGGGGLSALSRAMNQPAAPRSLAAQSAKAVRSPSLTPTWVTSSTMRQARL